MKSFFLRVLPGAAVFGFVFLFVCFISATRTNDVTVGSHIDLTVDDLNTPGVSSFEKKPGLSVTYPVKGKDKSRSLRVTQKGNQFKDGTRTNITGELRGSMPLSPPSYPLYVKPKAKGQKYNPILTDRLINVVPPQILTPLIMGEAGDTLSITGMYFGVKKPKLWIQYDEAGKEKILPCKLTKNFIYPDPKGNLKSCMDMITGVSMCEFIVNKKLPPGQIGVLHLANQVGKGTAPFNVPGPQLTIVADPAAGGTTIPAPGPHIVASNRPTNISAIPNDTFHFSEWRGPATAVIADPQAPATTVAITSDTTITAAFEHIAATNALLELVSVPTGRGTLVPPVGNYQITTGTPFSVAAYCEPGFHFERWYPGANTTVADQNSPTTTVTISGNGFLNAFFETNAAYQATLTVFADGNGSTSPTPGNHTFGIGSFYDVSAYPADGHQFYQWTGSGEVYFANSAVPSTRIIISNNAVITAHFIPIIATQNLLRINVMGPGTTDPAPGTIMLQSGDQQQLVAIPDESSHFIRWSGDGPLTLSDPNAPTTMVSLTDSASVIAHFARNSNETVNCVISAVPPEGGTTIPAPGTHPVYLDESFELQALPAAGYYFTGWSDASNVVVDDINSPNTTAVPWDNCSLSALFSPVSSNLTFAGVQLTYASNTDSVHLAWGEAVDESTPPAEMLYHVYAALTNKPDLIYLPQNLVTTLTGITTADITGLMPGTNYTFLVIPENSQGTQLLNSDVTSVATMSEPLELVSAVKNLADIVAAPVEGSMPECYFTGDYRDYFQTGEVIYVSLIDQPGGEPRRITRVYYSQYYNFTKLYSEPVVLEEVISEGDVNTRCVLTGLREVPDQQTNSPALTALPAPLLAQYASLTEQGRKVYVHPQGEFIMWEVAPPPSGDAEYEHTVDFGYGISYDYSLTFEPSLDYDSKWTSRWGPDRLDYARMVLGGALILEMQANYTVSGQVSFAVSRSGLLTKTIAFKYIVGGVPVYQEIELSLDAACYAGANAIFGATAKAKAEKNIALGLEWDRSGGWKTIMNEGFDSEFSLVFTNNVNFTSFVTIYPKITTKFYKTVSLHADIRPTFYLDANTTFSPEFSKPYFRSFDVYFQARGGVGASFDMFSKTLASYETNNLPLSDPYYFYTQPAVSNVPPTPEEPVDVDVGTMTVAVGIKDGTNNVVDPSGDGITWEVYDNWPHTDIVASDGRSIEIQWTSGVDAGGEGDNYYYVKMIGDGFLGEYGAYFYEGRIGIKDNSPMVTIADTALETALREKMKFPYNDFISVYKMMWLPTDLALTNKGISAVSGMEAADRVTKLYLQNNSIADLSPLAGMDALQDLYASNNGMDSCSSCSGLGVYKLGLSNNNISSVEPLVGNGTLYWLDVRANPLTRDTISNDVTRLRQQGVTVLHD